MARSPYEFLDSGSKERTLLLLLLAIIRKQGGELELTLQDLTAVGDGDSFIRYPADTGSSLMLRFARRGAEAYFLSETDPSTTNPRVRSAPSSARITSGSEFPSPSGIEIPLPPTTRRHAVHDDLDLALREEEMAERAAAASKQRMAEARAQSGALPWRTVKPQ